MTRAGASPAIILVVSAALASSKLAPAGRQLSFAKITSYEPASSVIQHSRIDLDQKEMEEHLGNGPDYTAAKNIYLLGGNSGGYAEITVGALANAAVKGSLVRQPGNSAAVGYMKSQAASGATLLKVTYTSTCKEGGSSSPDTSGCFTMAGGNIEVCGSTASPCSSYVSVGAPSGILNRYRTLAGFSTAAQGKMAGQEYYAVYRAYFGPGDYANQMVLSALDGTSSCAACDTVARVEVAKKTSAYMNVWMYVIREMEDAIMDCQSGCLNCNDDPVHAWDEAVAFYSGSLEGADGAASGKLLYRLAEKRCANFGTCTSAQDVNVRIMAEYKLGQARLLQGKCVEAVPIKRRIVQLMSVPLVQGTLRYAYKVDKLQGASKEKAEGHAFSKAILPRVAACDAPAAQVIANHMDYGATSTSFAAVKAAFESTYACLGITCEDVGGLRLNDGYYAGAEPCVSSSPGAQEGRGPPVGLIVAIVLISVLAVIGGLVAAFFYRGKVKAYQELEKSKMAAGGSAIGQGAPNL